MLLHLIFSSNNRRQINIYYWEIIIFKCYKSRGLKQILVRTSMIESSLRILLGTRDCPPSVINEVIRMMDSYLLPSDVFWNRDQCHSSTSFHLHLCWFCVHQSPARSRCSLLFPTVAFRDLFCRISPHWAEVALRVLTAASCFSCPLQSVAGGTE